MPDDDRSSENNVRGNIPVTSAPTHSKINLASRAPRPDRGSAAEAGPGIPQASAKPPPEASVFKERRRMSDAGPAVAELLEAPAWAEAGLRAAAAEAGGRRRIGQTAAWLLFVLVCIPTGVTRKKLDRAIVAPPHPAAVPRDRVAGLPEIVPGLPDDAGGALTAALDDLDSAVEGFPQQSPEQILRMVSGPGRDCRLLWKGHYPSIVFGMAPIRPNSLAANLEGCARAVKQLPR